MKASMKDRYFSVFFKELVVQENGLIVFGSDEFKETKEFMFLLLDIYKHKYPNNVYSLEKEIDYTAQKFYHKKLNSIYIGGGTPTLLGAKRVESLLKAVSAFGPVSEATIEANPADDIYDTLSAAASGGINRLSLCSTANKARRRCRD